MSTKLITYASNRPTTIIRNLSEGSEYSPDWRYRVFQEQIVSIRQNGGSKSREFLEREKDPYVRALILFHACRPTKLQKQLAYALGCNREKATTRIAGMIKAMAVANRSPQEIAKQIGTSAGNVTAFEKIFFDVRRYRRRRVWLKTICYPPRDPCTPDYLREEVRLMQVAYKRGWAGLQPLFCPDSSNSTKHGARHLFRSLLARAADHVDLLEDPSDLDIRRLAALSQAMAAVGIRFTAADLAFEEPLEPDEEKKRSLALAESIPPERRRRLAAAFNVIMGALVRESEKLPAPETGKSP